MSLAATALPRRELVTVEAAELRSRCRDLLASGGYTHMAYAWRPSQPPATDMPAPAPVEMRYLADAGRGKPFSVWRCRAGDGVLPSLAAEAPLLSWYEREAADGYGLRFQDHPEPYPLLWPTAPEREPRPPLAFEGPGVQRLPFGPVRGGVLESVEFLFYYAGEAILHYQPRLFFKHRGMEQRMEGLAAPTAVVFAERVSGVGSVAHALAFCQAVEDALGCTPPARAQVLRLLLAEWERLYNHLQYLGWLAHTTTLKVGEAEGRLLEERVKQLAAGWTGSRFLRGVLTPGGLRRDLNPGNAVEALRALRLDISKYVRRLGRSRSHLDRLLDNGLLDRRTAADQGATGPIGRASGLDRDLRRDHSYAAYDMFPLVIPGREAGDGNAREEVRMEEIAASMDLIFSAARALPPGPVRTELPAGPESAGAEGLGWSESPRGALFYAVHLAPGGRLARVKIKSPSFSNWRVFPFTVHGSNMMDYAINEASFGLTVAGCDR